MKQILGVELESIQSALLYCALSFLLLYLIALVLEKKPNWFYSATLRECLKMEERFDRLMASRRDVLHHYYWARSQGDRKKMKDMNKDLVRIDGEISQVRGVYHQKKSTLTKVVQKLM